MTRRESTASEEMAVGLKFLYRPGESSESPLVVLVHGRAGNRAVMWTFERSVPSSCHVVSFEAFLPDSLGGWSWWDMASPGSKREAIVYAAHRLKNAHEAFLHQFQLQPKRTVALGFSQGSVLVSAATFLGLAPFHAVGVLAGFVFLPTETQAFKHQPAVFVAHGTQDETISIEKAREGVATLRARGIAVEYVEEEVGHKVGIQGARALKQWMHAQVHST